MGSRLRTGVYVSTDRLFAYDKSVQIYKSAAGLTSNVHLISLPPSFTPERDRFGAHFVEPWVEYFWDSMKSSHFMDKQVTGMSEKSQGGDLFDLMDAQEEPRNNGGVIKKEEILPSYDFQPIRTVGSWPPMNAGLDAADSKKIGSSSLRVWSFIYFVLLSIG